MCFRGKVTRYDDEFVLVDHFQMLCKTWRKFILNGYNMVTMVTFLLGKKSICCPFMWLKRKAPCLK